MPRLSQDNRSDDRTSGSRSVHCGTYPQTKVPVYAGAIHIGQPAGGTKASAGYWTQIPRISDGERGRARHHQDIEGRQCDPRNFGMALPASGTCGVCWAMADVARGPQATTRARATTPRADPDILFFFTLILPVLRDSGGKDEWMMTERCPETSHRRNSRFHWSFPIKTIGIIPQKGEMSRTFFTLFG